MSGTSEPVVLGIDLGGTKILAAAIAADGRILSRAKRKTRPERGQLSILDRLSMCARWAMEMAQLSPSDVQAVGIGSPGPLDIEKGIVIDTPNLPLTQAPIVASLERDLGIPVVIDNDVNVGTLGEKVYGAGKDVNDVIGLFPGTGLGGGIILGGRLHRGVSMNAGELGHITVQMNGPECGCGKKGCLEAYASRTGIVRRIQELVKANKKKKTSIVKIIDGKWEQVTSSVLAQAYAEDDEYVTQAMEEAADAMGVAIGSLCNILGPEMVILGGGMMDVIDAPLFERICETAHRNAFPINIERVRIVRAQLGDDAGILGAAALAWQALQDRPELQQRRRPKAYPRTIEVRDDRVIVDGAHFAYDIFITPSGDVWRRSRRVARQLYGSPGRLVPDRIRELFNRLAETPKHLIVSSVNPSEAIGEDIIQFFQERNCQYVSIAHDRLDEVIRATPDPKVVVILLKV